VVHGTILVGDLEVTALCDVEVDFPRTLEEAFPDVPSDSWPDIDAAHPGLVGADHRWHFHDHSFLVRAERTTLLFDTGVGPPETVGAAFIHPPGGTLPDELRTAGVDPSEVDLVVLSHLHLDHIGWNATTDPDGKVRSVFPQARYLIQRAEREGFLDDADEDDIAALELSVVALERLGAVELVDGERAIGRDLTLLPTPGHTPGSQSLLLGRGDERAMLCGDLANHPLQVERPDLRSRGDRDHRLAAATRRRILDRAEAEGLLLSCAHFPDPFGRVVSDRGRRTWRPLALAEHGMERGEG
jgi:glyoxylase-like metal-dependent hydrolase (beta-lactamase superfamily II)